jgi:hypothetical protein
LSCAEIRLVAVTAIVEVGVISTGAEVEEGLSVGEADGVEGLAEGVVNGGFVPEHPFIKMKTGTKSQKSFFVKAEFILSSLVALK